MRLRKGSGHDCRTKAGYIMETDNYIQMMIDSLRMKQRILEKIVSLNEEQSRLVSATSFDEAAFQQNMEEKGELIENLVKLDEGFSSVFDRVKEKIEGHRPDYKEEISTMQDLIKTVTAIGVQVEAQEARNKVMVQNKFDTMRRDIQNAKRSTQKTSVYYQNMNKINNEPYFMDQKK